MDVQLGALLLYGGIAGVVLFALAGLGVRRRGLLAGAQNTRRSQNRQDGRNELFYGLFVQK